MSQIKVRTAIETALSTWAATQSLPVAWENVETTHAGTYLRANMLPGNTDSRDLARDHRGYVGVYQITVVCPTGTGPGAAVAIAAALETLFDPGTKLTYSGVTVWITQPLSFGPAIYSGDRYLIPCSLLYRADVY